MALSPAEELQWLIDNPHFEERPASMTEFVGQGYLNIADRVRPAVMQSLVDMFGETTNTSRIAKYQLGMWTGGIGIGKTTIASIILPYMAHWVLCLRDPQAYYGLLPGSRIAFMQMSTSSDQAREVVFGDIKARINHSAWFMDRYPPSTAYKNQLRFEEKDIWILPGDSMETTFEGYNILGGILDEADSHKITKVKDYAEQGFTTIYSRITSRFKNDGFMLVIGQMKKANGFAARKYEELKRDPDAYTCRMSIWESFGWDHYLTDDGERDSFFYDIKRKTMIPKGAMQFGDSSNFVEVPNTYRRDFENNPEKALRDLMGVPPAVGDPFISLPIKIEEAQQRYIDRHGVESPYEDRGGFIPDFAARESLKRVCHIDMAFSGNGDALGFAMGHVHEMVETDDGELKPYIVIDCMVRISALPGTEIFIGDIRRMIYDLRDSRNFKINMVTLDGFQSTDTRQQLTRKRIASEHVSVDRTLIPYYDLRDALYEGRIEFPRYMVALRHGDVSKVDIIAKELTELEETGEKIDHPPNGSKDISDAVAGVVYTLIGDRSYHKKVLRYSPQLNAQQPSRRSGDGSFIGGLPMTAPPVDHSIITPATSWNPPRKARR